MSSSFTFFGVFDRNDFVCDNDGGIDAVSFDPVGGGVVTVVLVRGCCWECASGVVLRGLGWILLLGLARIVPSSEWENGMLAIVVIPVVGAEDGRTSIPGGSDIFNNVCVRVCDW